MNIQPLITSGAATLTVLALAACSGGGATGALSSSPAGATAAPLAAVSEAADPAAPLSATTPATTPVITPVDTDTAGDQQDPALACNDADQCIVAWNSTGAGDRPDGIYARRYTAQGVPTGGSFRVTTFANGRYMKPVVGIDRTGGFVVAWIASHSVPPGMTVWARRYGADATALAAPFRVDASGTFNRSVYPQLSLAMRATGAFMLAWAERAPVLAGMKLGFIVTRSYAVDGSPQGGPRTIAFGLDPLPRAPQVAMNAQGRYVVVWDSDGSGVLGAGGRQTLRKLADDVGDIGNSLTFCPMDSGSLLCDLGFLLQPFVFNAPRALGSFLQNMVGGWVGLLAGGSALNGVAGGTITGLSAGINDVSGLLTGLGIQVQFFSPAGIATSPPMTVAFSTPLEMPDRPTVTMNAAGRGAVTWQATYADGSPEGVFIETYSFPGGGDVPSVDQFTRSIGLADDGTMLLQRQPAVAIDADGDVAVAASGSEGIQLWRARARWFEPVRGPGPILPPQRPKLYPVDPTQAPDSLLNPVVSMPQVDHCLMAWQRYTAGPQGRDVVVAPCPMS